MSSPADRFVPEESSWIQSHYGYIPDTVAFFCGDLQGARILDVGSGEMLADFGLLRFGPREIVGLDLVGRRPFTLPAVAERFSRQGIAVPADYESRLRYVEYDGIVFPFEDAAFDVIFSWSAFEHISDVPGVLREIRRVCRPEARVFIQVSPWFHSLDGSHLTDFIAEPYFHLKRSTEWVQQRLHEYVVAHPDRREYVLENLWPEYLSLNGYSARRFYADAIAAGFRIQRAVAVTCEQDLSQAPRDAAFDELMIVETKMLLRPADPLAPADACSRVDELAAALRDREAEIADLRNSWSWRITAPLRKIGALFLNR